MTKVFIFSGAGISQESGIQTFRDADGMWENHSVDDVCNISTWRSNYDLVHNFYSDRRAQLKDVEPNKAHLLVADLQKRFGKENIINITTNVDDLFERAGVEDTIHLHGDITKMVNVTNGEEFSIGYDRFDTSTDELKVIKPSVIFFGEQAPEYDTLASIQNFDMTNDDIVVFVGMSFQVVPMFMCVPYWKQPQTININPDSKTHGQADIDYAAIASEGLARAIENIINKRMK